MQHIKQSVQHITLFGGAAIPDILAFLSYILLTTFTPGPNNIICMTNASKYGFKNGIRFNFGIFFGFLIIISASMALTSFLYALMPKIRILMTITGSLYMLWLIYKILKTGSHNTDGVNMTANSFISGLLLQFVNPKVILFCLTSVSTFIIPYYDSVRDLFLFSLFIAFVGFCATCSWSAFGSFFGKLFMKYRRTANFIMSALLLYCAFSLYLH